MMIEGGKLLTNSNFDSMLHVSPEHSRRHIIPADFKKEIDDLGFVGDCLLISSSTKSKEEVDSSLHYRKNISYVEFSLNKRPIVEYFQVPEITLSHAFGIFLTASKLAKVRSLSLGVRSIHCGFYVPVKVKDVVRPPHHAIWTLFRNSDDLVYDPNELEGFQIEGVAHLIM